MLTLPNILSLLRIPLALVFLQENPIWRAMAIVLAMATDGLDGYLARRYRQTTKTGTLLDPITDRLFVVTVLVVLLFENRLNLWEAATLMVRDLSVIAFGIYLAITGKLPTYRFRALWCGKATTFLQFTVLLGLTLNYKFPPYIYGVFILLGILALAELYLRPHAKDRGDNPKDFFEH